MGKLSQANMSVQLQLCVGVRHRVQLLTCVLFKWYDVVELYTSPVVGFVRNWLAYCQLAG